VPKAYLHIGCGKAGSTLIQGLLNEPDAKRFIKPSFDASFSTVLANHTPVADFSDFNTKIIWEGIRESLPEGDIALSVENFCGVMTHTENLYEESVRAIKYLFDGYDIKLLLFVRRQDGYIESMYNQDVKRQEVRSFPEYFADVRLDNLHWDKACDAYSEFDLTVLPFEKKVIQPTYTDFVDGLFQWLGEKLVITDLPVINPSLSLEGLEVQLLANRVLPAKTAYDLSLWLQRHAAKKPGDKHGLFEDTKILERYRESNERLFKKYMPRIDGAFYWGG